MPTTVSDPALATAVAEPQANRSLTFVIRGPQAETVVPVIYVNGAGDHVLPHRGGADFRLEVDSQGRSIGRLGVLGATVFAGP